MTIVIPLGPTRAGRTLDRRDPSPEWRAWRDKIRTLVVDDEPMARERVLSLLQQEDDVEVVGECGDGAQAVAAIQHHTPDLVFLDVQMPGVDGFGVIQAIGAERMPTVVFVTAYDEYALRAFEVHALDYLLKPFGRDRFRETLSTRARSSSAAAPATWAAGCSRWSTTSSPKRRSSIGWSSSPAAACSSCAPTISTGSRRPATTCGCTWARKRTCSARR